MDGRFLARIYIRRPTPVGPCLVEERPRGSVEADAAEPSSSGNGLDQVRVAVLRWGRAEVEVCRAIGIRLETAIGSDVRERRLAVVEQRTGVRVINKLGPVISAWYVVGLARIRRSNFIDRSGCLNQRGGTIYS